VEAGVHLKRFPDPRDECDAYYELYDDDDAAATTDDHELDEVERLAALHAEDAVETPSSQPRWRRPLAGVVSLLLRVDVVLLAIALSSFAVAMALGCSPSDDPSFTVLAPGGEILDPSPFHEELVEGALQTATWANTDLARLVFTQECEAGVVDTVCERHGGAVTCEGGAEVESHRSCSPEDQDTTLILVFDPWGDSPVEELLEVIEADEALRSWEEVGDTAEELAPWSVPHALDWQLVRYDLVGVRSCQGSAPVTVPDEGGASTCPYRSSAGQLPPLPPIFCLDGGFSRRRWG